MCQHTVTIYLLASRHLDGCVWTLPAITADLGGPIPDPDILTSSLLSRGGRAEDKEEQQQHLQWGSRVRHDDSFLREIVLTDRLDFRLTQGQ